MSVVYLKIILLLYFFLHKQKPKPYTNKTTSLYTFKFLIRFIYFLLVIL